MDGICVVPQGLWTPISDFLFESNLPLISIFGPVILDFQVALIAILVHEAFLVPLSSPVITHTTSDSSSNGNLIDIDDDPLLQPLIEELPTETDPLLSRSNPLSFSHTTASPRHDPQQAVPPASHLYRPRSPQTLSLIAFLFLSILSIQSASLLSFSSSQTYLLANHTPLSLACVLPPSPPQHQSLQLPDYVSELRRLAPRAKILLTPETALSAHTQAALDEIIDGVGAIARDARVWVGVGVLGPPSTLGEG
jgi:hypothetical protein